ncbi:MAG: hypothetical protein Q4B28_02635 [bacterium]|nr:hypothetical protein [bacterium]
MTGVVDAVKNMYEGLHENQKTTLQLLELKKQMAGEIVDEVSQQFPELFLTVGKEMVVDYLVSEGFFDKIKDKMMESTIMKISASSARFKEWREQLGKVSTQEELKALKAKILGGMASAADPERSEDALVQSGAGAS